MPLLHLVEGRLEALLLHLGEDGHPILRFLLLLLRVDDTRLPLLCVSWLEALRLASQPRRQVLCHQYPIPSILTALTPRSVLNTLVRPRPAHNLKLLLQLNRGLLLYLGPFHPFLQILHFIRMPQKRLGQVLVPVQNG